MNSVSAVTDPAAPKVLEAHGTAGDQLDFDHVYFAQYVTAQVPHFTGMARGHTVRITWENPRHTYHSQVITVGTPGTIDIRIPRMEVIDSIGHTVKVFYTVLTAPGTTLIPSRYLLLRILPQPFDLLAPTLSSDQKTVSVNYSGMTTGYTVRVRATANTLWESDTRPVQAGVTPVFTLPSDWRTNNRGADALINYTVYKSGSGERLMFSKVLRTRIGEVTPAINENFDDIPTQLITVGQRIALSSMTITFLSGNGQMGISNSLTYPPIPGKRSGQLLHLCYQALTAPQRCRIDLKSAYSKVSFWQTWTDNATTTTFFYNTAGQLLGERTFTRSVSDAHLVEFTSNGITRIEILCRTPDWIGLDYFSFTP